jgi:hypothetical protein
LIYESLRTICGRFDIIESCLLIDLRSLDRTMHRTMDRTMDRTMHRTMHILIIMGEIRRLWFLVRSRIAIRIIKLPVIMKGLGSMSIIWSIRFYMMIEI